MNNKGIIARIFADGGIVVFFIMAFEFMDHDKPFCVFLLLCFQSNI